MGKTWGLERPGNKEDQQGAWAEKKEAGCAHLHQHLRSHGQPAVSLDDVIRMVIGLQGEGRGGISTGMCRAASACYLARLLFILPAHNQSQAHLSKQAQAEQRPRRVGPARVQRHEQGCAPALLTLRCCWCCACSC